MMMSLVLGGLAFVFFILYDWNQVADINRLFKSFFLIGCLLLAVASWGLWQAGQSDRFYTVAFFHGFFGLLAALSGLVLIYILFFAVPFTQTYIEGSSQDLMTEGVYAACRHPGAWFFFFSYLFAGLAGGSPLFILGGFLFSLLNLAYIALQDQLFFPRIFEGYTDYQSTTRFILPTKDSIRSCFRYYRTGGRR